MQQLLTMWRIYSIYDWKYVVTISMLEDRDDFDKWFSVTSEVYFMYNQKERNK